VNAPSVLAGPTVRLEPLGEEHVAPLMAIAKAHVELYRYTSTPTTDAEAKAYFERAFREREAGRAYPFALRYKGEVVGTSRLAEVRLDHRNCELGYTWLAPSVQGTTVNSESKYLLLGYAFETLKLLRVYFYTDTRNVRSQRALERLGAVYEGTLRAERVMRDGYVRDTKVYSVLQREWPAVKAKLEIRLGLR
jgi:RimJ/RimL family protein N-acetyltransferase